MLYPPKLVWVTIRDKQSTAAWFSAICYIVIAYAALLGGTLITTILMLNNAVRAVTQAVDPNSSSTLAVPELPRHQNSRDVSLQSANN